MPSLHNATLRTRSRLEAWYPVLLPLSIMVNGLVLFLFLTLPARASSGDGNPQLEKLYASYISPCCWRENLMAHNSSEATRPRAQIAGMVQDGKTDEQIKQTLVAEYGKRIMSLPEGGTRVWLFWTPVTLLAAGGIGLIGLLRHMRRTPSAPVYAGPPAQLDPIELGMTGKEDVLLKRLKTEPRYRRIFPQAFPVADPFTLENVTKAIASFERTILSGDSPYDRYRRGDDPNAISDAAKRGESLFFSERLECFHCHGGFNFTGTVDYYGKGIAVVEFHNTGLCNLKGAFSYPQPNLGLYTFTQSSEDVGKFKAPTLRNIALTAPYMHDGSVKTLAESIDHYAAGGRKIASGPRAGDDSQNSAKSEFVKGFQLSPSEKQDLLAFLRSLTDQTLLTNPALSDPWVRTATTHIVISAAPASRYRLNGTVMHIYPNDSTIALAHDAVSGLMGGMRAPLSMEFLVRDAATLDGLRPGDPVNAWVERQGSDYVLSGLVKRP